MGGRRLRDDAVKKQRGRGDSSWGSGGALALVRWIGRASFRAGVKARNRPKIPAPRRGPLVPPQCVRRGFVRYDGAWAEDVSGRCGQRGRQDSVVGAPARFFLMEIGTMTRHAGNLGGEP